MGGAGELFVFNGCLLLSLINIASFLIKGVCLVEGGVGKVFLTVLVWKVFYRGRGEWVFLSMFGL